MEKKHSFEIPYILKSKQGGGVEYYLTFFIWPLGIMLTSFSNWRKPWAKNIFWIFCIFFGYTFIIANEGGADSDRYARLFLEYARSKYSFVELVKSFYSESSSYVDVASPIISYLVSRFTNNPSILFAVFGLIFGYFHSRNIWILLERIKGNYSFIIVLYLITFMLLNPIWNINGFRMWTAAQIFLYGTLQFFINKRKEGLAWAFVSILFHFSFLFPIGILGAYIFLKNRINLYFSLFIITSFIKEIDLNWARSMLLYLPEIFHTKIINYTNVEYAEVVNSIRESLNWHIAFADTAIQIAVYLTMIYVFVFAKDALKRKSYLEDIFCYILLFYAGANIFSFIPSGYRYISVVNIFVFSFLIILLSLYPNLKGFSVVRLLSVPLLLFYCIIMIRMGMDFYSMMTLIGNPIVAVFQDADTPIIEIIKRVL
jgi:hypothetical protein